MYKNWKSIQKMILEQIWYENPVKQNIHTHSCDDMELVRFMVNWLELTIRSKFFTLTKFCFTDHSPAENLVNFLISVNESDSQLVRPIIKMVGQTEK